MPAIENHTIKAGDDKVFVFTVDPSDLATISGTTIRWWMARSPYTKPEKATLKKNNISPGDVAILDPDDRTFSVTVYRDETLGLVGEFYHEAQITDTLGNWATVTTGILTFERTLIREES